MKMHTTCALAMFRVLALAMASAAIAGCTVKSFDSTKVTSAPTDKVQAVHVAFVDSHTGQNTGKVAIGGLIDLAANKYIQSKADETKEKNRVMFDQIFTDGFRNKFPTAAANYGLTVSETAPVEFRVTVGDQKTQCSLYGCVSRFTMEGDLLDPSGKSLWHFTTEIGQSSIFAEMPPLFDKFITEVLNAMKKDGVIGGT